MKYENTEEVGIFGDETHFDLPKNIDLWNPSNGSIVVILLSERGRKLFGTSQFNRIILSLRLISF